MKKKKQFYKFLHFNLLSQILKKFVLHWKRGREIKSRMGYVNCTQCHAKFPIILLFLSAIVDGTCGL